MISYPRFQIYKGSSHPDYYFLDKSGNNPRHQTGMRLRLGRLGSGCIKNSFMRLNRGEVYLPAEMTQDLGLGIQGLGLAFRVLVRENSVRENFGRVGLGQGQVSSHFCWEVYLDKQLNITELKLNSMRKSVRKGEGALQIFRANQKITEISFLGLKTACRKVRQFFTIRLVSNQMEWTINSTHHVNNGQQTLNAHAQNPLLSNQTCHYITINSGFIGFYRAFWRKTNFENLFFYLFHLFHTKNMKKNSYFLL